MEVVLTVADHEQNGFVSVARWRFPDEAAARRFIEDGDRAVSDDSEPDIKAAPFTFILDLMDGWDQIDTGKRLLPTQIAMSLAPDQVQRWLVERPIPDCAINRAVPLLANPTGDSRG